MAILAHIILLVVLVSPGFGGYLVLEEHAKDLGEESTSEEEGPTLHATENKSVESNTGEDEGWNAQDQDSEPGLETRRKKKKDSGGKGSTMKCPDGSAPKNGACMAPPPPMPNPKPTGNKPRPVDVPVY